MTQRVNDVNSVSLNGDDRQRRSRAFPNAINDDEWMNTFARTEDGRVGVGGTREGDEGEEKNTSAVSTSDRWTTVHMHQSINDSHVERCVPSN